MVTFVKVEDESNSFSTFATWIINVAMGLWYAYDKLDFFHINSAFPKALLEPHPQDTHCGGSFPSVEKQSLYSTVPADWASFYLRASV